jgi:DNA polymerase III alpha subunit (gram-positive type)
MDDDATYFVTDIEGSGFRPGVHSMLAFATVAVSASGEERGRFEAVLAELPDATWDPQVRAWFESEEPEALVAATHDPREPAAVMADFVAFVQAIPGRRVFAAHPVAFDGAWIDHYLQALTTKQLLAGLYAPEAEQVFHDTLCLRSYAAAVLGRAVREVSASTLPPVWLGDVPHTHRAIDDALGYTHLLAELFRRSGATA